ncbi:hypothetical protein JEQ12_002393 [Ovis aries]|uniref:Uncharacterized protein n=1 Tax=Ovis aries TaxID=9940 RepID=A0A836CYU8_SHEEP|nr:hypothetical protein JEQ12_002393 [Ovis aries]
MSRRERAAVGRLCWNGRVRTAAGWCARRAPLSSPLPAECPGGSCCDGDNFSASCLHQNPDARTAKLERGDIAAAPAGARPRIPPPPTPDPSLDSRPSSNIPHAKPLNLTEEKGILKSLVHISMQLTP